MSNTPQNLEHINTALLIPYARNSRTHSPVQVQQVANSIKRWQNYTGKQAVLEATGQTFDELSEA